MARLLYDAYRFTLHFADTIIASARHIYLSALPFVPSCLLYQTYQTRVWSAAVKVHHSRDYAWPPYLRTLSGHSGSVDAVAVSKDGAHLASGSSDRTMRVWDSSTGTLLAKYEAETSLNSVAFSADGSRVIACTNEHAHVWNWTTGTSLRWFLNSPQSPAWRDSIAVASNTGTRFVVCSNDNVHWWDPETSLQLKTTCPYSGRVTSVALSPDDSKIVTTSMDNTMCLSESSTGKFLKAFYLPEAIASFSPDGHQLLSASKDRICIWDVQTGAKLGQRKCIPAQATNLCFSPDRTRLVTVVGGRILVFDTSSGKCTFESRFGRQWDRYERIHIRSAAFSIDGTRIFSGLSDSTIRIWDLSVDHKPDTSEHKHLGLIEGVAFSPDCTRICTWIWDQNYIRVWDLPTGRLLCELTGHTLSVTSVAFSPDSTQIVSGSYDTTIRIWDSVTGHQVKKLNIRGVGEFNVPVCAALSPDGARLACGSHARGGRFIVPTLADFLGKVQKLHCPGSTTITFSEDGSHVYSLLDSPLTVTQWDTRSGKVVSRSKVPYNQTALGRDPLLKKNKAWIVPVSNPSRKLFYIPITYLPLRQFCTYGPFVVLVGPEKFAILDFSHIIS